MPPRGSPKPRKGQTSTSNTGASLASRASPTGSKPPPLVAKYNKTHTLKLDEHVPKFGDRLSPSNVRDWLELNFADSFVGKNADEKKTVPSPTPPQIIQQKDIGISRVFAHKNQDLQRQSSFLSQSGRSSIGSIIRGFPPITRENIKVSRKEKEKQKKRDYLQYVDMVIRENDDDDDNILATLSSVVEFKNEIEAKPKRKVPKLEDVPVKAPREIRRNPSSTTILESKYVKHRAPSIILEDSDYSQSVVSLSHSLDLDINERYMNNTKFKKRPIRCLDDTLTNFSRDGELV